jgi:hypothetical protein
VVSRNCQASAETTHHTRAAQLGALLGEQAAYLIDPLEVAVAETVQPVADLWFELEVVQAPYPAAHASLDYLAFTQTQPLAA